MWQGVEDKQEEEGNGQKGELRREGDSTKQKLSTRRSRLKEWEEEGKIRTCGSPLYGRELFDNETGRNRAQNLAPPALLTVLCMLTREVHHCQSIENFFLKGIETNQGP